MNKYFHYVFAGWALLLALFTVHIIFLACYSGPYRDMWVVMDFIRSWFAGTASSQDLFALHGGAHRIAVPKLLFLVEYGLFHGSNLFLMLVACLVQLSMVYLVWHKVRDEPSFVAGDRLLLVSLCLLLMFNATQLENFLYTFDVQWFITVAAAAWALHYWIASRALAGCVCGLISVFSSFSGMCVWLLLPLVMVFCQRRRLYFVMAICLVTSLLLLYTRGPFGQTAQWIGIQGDITPVSLVHFVCALAVLWLKWIFLYLGSPLGREYFYLASCWVAASFVFLGYQLFRWWRLGAKYFSSFQVWCLFIAGFAITVGLATGWGRMHFVNTADEDRYQSVVALYWLGTFGLAYSQARFRPFATGAIIFWACLVIPCASIKDARAQLNHFDRVNTANLAMATGQWEFQAIKSTLILGDQWKQINRPEMHAAFLQENGWGIFAAAPAQLLGKHLADIPVMDDSCEGQVLSVTPVGGGYQGYRLTGRAHDVQHDSLFKHLLIVSDDHRVVGLARLQREKDSLLPVAWQNSEQALWAGYTLDLPQVTPLQVWGERQDASYCLVGKTATIPAPSIK